MSGFNSQLMEKEEATRSVEQKFKDAKVGESRTLFCMPDSFFSGGLPVSKKLIAFTCI